MRSLTAPDCTTSYSEPVTSQLRPSLELLERVLGENLLALRIEATETASATAYTIQGEGVGLIDALFRALVDRFAPEYRSLEALYFSNFSIRARRDANGNLFGFDASGRSIASAATQAVVAGVEYFVNAERAELVGTVSNRGD